MQRQKSILSFFQKPTASGGGDAAPPALEARGSDTPPEKLPRTPLFSSSLAGAGTGCQRAPLAFSDVMHKFARNPKHSNPLNCNGPSGRGVHFNSEDGVQEIVEKREKSSCERSRFTHASRLGNYSTEVEPKILDFDLDDQDKLGPDTPLMRPLVPGLKRIKENCQDVSINHGVLLAESNKRMKLLRETGQVDVGGKDPDESFKAGSSKFEWLNPSSIRDANKRRPNDPLYDRRTLYIPLDALAKMSATQRQYWDVKRQYMDVVLFFKVGKFYELYELDAEVGQKELDWKMTHSGVGKCRQVGISESGIDDAVKKLMARGYKVGRMEQVESSGQAKARGATSVIQRKLIDVSTPSTTTDSSMRPDAVYLLALNEEKGRLEDGSTMYGFAFVDVAALKFWVGSFSDDDSHSSLGALLVQVSPKEIVFEDGGLSRETLKAIQKFTSAGATSLQLTSVPSMGFLDASKVRDFVKYKGYFKESTDFWSSAVICQVNLDLSICALGGLISYLSRLKLDAVLCNGDLLPYQVYTSCLKLNGQTLVNLEIFNNNIDGGSSGTLYKHLDHCTTSAGKRLLRRWICHPLTNIEDINDRLTVVEGLVKNPGICSVVSEYLHKLPDLERLLGRIKSFVGASATYLLPMIGVKVLKQQVKSFGSLVKGLHIGLDLLNIILKDDHGFIPFSRVLNLPVLTELDEVLNQFEVAMQEDFPNYWDHDVQESDVEVLSQLVEQFVKVTGWSQVIQALSCLDVLNSFGMAATLSEGSMSRPVFLPADSCSTDSSQKRRGIILKIKGLWHPYAVPNMGSTLVPNDIHLGENSTGSHTRTLLVTGPNMGGKSTLLRATCLATILAQLGCFVPCDSCILSPADVIFTRLGATDRIMSGESTFFIECAETASILQHATQDSLVLLDELGRGTSTFDGYAIAYAVFRHLVEKLHCRLLFATHYHPLTKEFASHPNVSLQHMACAFKPRTPSFANGEELVFLYRLTPGACPESYGLQVALMAGIPNLVVEIASQAGQRMKTMLGNNFKLSEGRCMFSTMHEESLKTLLPISKMDNDGVDEDSFDTLICLWHELKSMYRQRESF